MIWTYGITTISSRIHNGLLTRTMESLEAGGFDTPKVYVDDHKGAMANWYAALIDLYVRTPQADRYAIFQDDIVCYKNLRQYLDAVPYPDKGYLNLFTFRENEATIYEEPVRWHKGCLLYPKGTKRPDSMRKDFQAGRGAVALVFNREAVMKLLTSEAMICKFQADHRERNIDGAVVTAMNLAGYTEYVHCPSLVQHVGEMSTLYIGKQHVYDAKTFRGEAFNALDLL